MTVALDDDWGTGKSFFVNHWSSDLRESGYPVVFFDAWENDIGDEAAIALMAVIKAEFEVWRKRIPLKLREQMAASTEKAIKGLRRAVIPASKVIAAGLLKKTAGIAVEDLIKTLDAAEVPSLSDQIGVVDSDAIDKGLDKLFAKLLDDHEKRREAIASFKLSIGDSIRLVESKAKAKLPVFVFIDEVDRCRPTYAIKLLEEIKHIFGVPNVCFVVSTNLNQLKESTRAIYGIGFDGYKYLQRFFDFRYTLPKPANDRFSSYLLKSFPLPNRKSELGLPNNGGSKDGSAPTVETLFALMARAFGLDLRSQKQMLSLAMSVVGSVNSERSFFNVAVLPVLAKASACSSF